MTRDYSWRSGFRINVVLASLARDWRYSASVARRSAAITISHHHLALGGRQFGLD